MTLATLDGLRSTFQVAARDSTSLRERPIELESSTIFTSKSQAPTTNHLFKRDRALAGCNPGLRAAIIPGLANCAAVARAAADDALGGPDARFDTYFRTGSVTTHKRLEIRRSVSKRLAAIANECAQPMDAEVTVQCTDTYNQCSMNVKPGRYITGYHTDDVLVVCPAFQMMSLLPFRCHDNLSRPTLLIHEMSHSSEVYSPRTTDLAYHYEGIIELGPRQAVLSADTYSVYANGEMCSLFWIFSNSLTNSRTDVWLNCA